MATTTIEHEWEIELPATSAEQVLAALASRDRLFGQSITLEPEDTPDEAVEAWLAATEVLDGQTIRLGVYVELSGPKEFLEPARDAIEDLVSEHVEAAATEASEAKVVARRPAAEVEFRQVGEDEERPQLIIPEWLAPAKVELPWSFRSCDGKGDLWPDDRLVAAHERLALIPFGGEMLLYALPALPEDEDE
ncbi:MAG TPA: hypothetical protein VLW17_04135 [Thermoanaerobaculaceae bacterium]|nr:hypothetical protein [Thermoanaerobaculaceae bacterium]